MNNKDKVATLLNSLSSIVKRNARFDILSEGPYKGALKGSFVKTYEYAQYVNRTRKPSGATFFLSAGLRGICEDIICLKFIGQLDRKKRDEVMFAKMMLEVGKSAERQKEFFEKNRPFQPVFSYKDNAKVINESKSKLKALGGSTGLWSAKSALPTIEQMALNVNLEQLYRFIYSITSDVVHFNPRITLRNGWGDAPKPGEMPRRVKFSTMKFAGYYLDFMKLYGIYLFLLFVDTFESELTLNKHFIESREQLRSVIDDQLRWPEAVTFEEMNIQTPGNNLWRIVLRVAHDEKAKKVEQVKK